mgnify:FL=1
MLIFHDAARVVFSIPRTGSTSLHKALRPFADTEFSNPPNKKHMTVQRFETWAATRRPRVLEYTRVAVMREPLARMASWYRYRQRDAVKEAETSTRDMSFAEFLELAHGEAPPPAAAVGNQHKFLTLKSGELGVDELFCIERADVLMAYLESHFGEIALPHRNSAPDIPLDLHPAIEARIRDLRSEEFALFSQVAPTGRYSCPRVPTAT